jgi:hypothetical protein
MAYTGKKIETKVYDVYTKDETDSQIANATPDFSSLEGKPTTLSGYGITDAYTQSEVNTAIGNIDLSPYATLANPTFTGDGITIPSLASDPVSPVAAQLYYNTTDRVFKHYDGTAWQQLTNKFSASGGNATYEFNGYKIHVFTSSGSFSADAAGTIDVLVVAGGGGGGAHVPGGGGAGGLIFKPNLGVTPGVFSITVGAGGSGSYNPGNYGGMPNATAGQNSSAFGLTAIGGGFAGSWSQDTRSHNGGSGGGCNGQYSPVGIGTQPSQSGDSGIYGFGNNGAKSNSPGNSPYGCGGGGGAGATPPNTPNKDTSGIGGAGKDYSSFFGTNIGESGWFAGGGEGGAWGTVTLQSGGIGGGGDGDCPTNGGNGVSLRRGSGEPTGYSGMAGTGGGGGGAGRTGGESSRGGNGGSGIVLVRYLI